MLANKDVLEAQFNLVNDGVVMMNSQQNITKLNKSAEILFNTTATRAVGKTITDLLGTRNNHFMNAVAEVVAKAPYASMLKTHVALLTGAKDAT